MLRYSLPEERWMETAGRVGNRQASPPPHLAELMTLKRDDIPASKLGVAAKSLHKDKRASLSNPQDRRWHFLFVGAKELASVAAIGSGSLAEPLAHGCSASTQFLAIKQAQPQAPARWKRGLFFAAACDIINQLEPLMRRYLPAELSSKPCHSSPPPHILHLSQPFTAAPHPRK